MIIIGITGIIGSGKTTVSNMLAREGYKIIDLDRVAKECLKKKETKEKIGRVFGKEVIKEGSVDTERLKDIVFKDKENIKRLEEIVHPEIKEETKRRIEHYRKLGERAVIIDGPLLVEKGMYKEMDKLVVVSTKKEALYNRLKKRGMDERDIERRMGLQIPLEEKEKIADYIVKNDGDKEELMGEVKKLVECIKRWEGEVYAS
ncbi:MAG: dephospho-CoA kinase [Syntrophorhabdaceae bacterium]|nr:dephospho-CoA kinase [Syntrophorhabdaceae bacterium]